VKDYTARTYGDRHAAVYDEWYGDDGGIALTRIGNPDQVATHVAHLADGGPVLELGVGSGRLALPLAAQGLTVTGVDASAAMLDLLRAKPDADQITLIEGDMADPPGLADNSFAVVLVGFNTFFNLTTLAAQTTCMASIERLLQPGGHLVIEAFVPAPDGHDGLTVRTVELDRVLLDAVQIDPEQQTITGQRIEITEDGNRLFPYLLRYLTPEQFDQMAAQTGMGLLTRHENWAGEAFAKTSGTHVSVWQKPLN
jgi:ubiquinone/menaquinone biosynthesis C-methylase UbiE